jgi:hypothetical protein
MRTRFSARSNLIFFETFARTSRRKSRIERVEASRLPNENTSHFRIPPMIYSRLLTASVVAALITSCAAAFVAPYDETTDRLLTDLSVKTETAIARADSGKLSEDDRAKFYDEALGTVRTMKRRSSLFAKNEDEIKALTRLEQRLVDLREHGSSPRSSLATGLRATILAVEQIQVAKKRSSVFSAGLKKSGSTE